MPLASPPNPKRIIRQSCWKIQAVLLRNAKEKLKHTDRSLMFYILMIKTINKTPKKEPIAPKVCNAPPKPENK